MHIATILCASFRSIVDAADCLLPDCEDCKEAATIACENHGIIDSEAVAIVAHCIANDAADPDFWAGDFWDAVCGA